MNAREFAAKLDQLGSLAAAGDFAVALRDLAELLRPAGDTDLIEIRAAIAKALKPLITAAGKRARSEQKLAQSQQAQAQREQKARERESAAAAKQAERARKAAEKQAKDETKRIERERKAAEKTAAAADRAKRKDAVGSRFQAASPADIEAGYRLYQEIFDSVARLSIADIRMKFASVRQLGKPVLQAIAEKLNYHFKGSAKRIADELLGTLENLKVTYIADERIRGGP